MGAGVVAVVVVVVADVGAGAGVGVGAGVVADVVVVVVFVVAGVVVVAGVGVGVGAGVGGGVVAVVREYVMMHAVVRGAKTTRSRVRAIALDTLGLETVARAASRRGQHPTTVRRWVASGLLPAVVVGRGRSAVYLVRVADVDAIGRRVVHSR